jgi:hypothetical protein
LLTVASAVEDQETWVVKSCVLLLLYTPVAYNCTEVPFATDGVAGVVEPCVPVMTILCSVGAEFTTLRPKGADVMPFKAAVILVVVEVVGSAAVAIPPAAMVAAAILLEAHVAVLVIFAVLASLYVPVAVN